MKNILLVGCGNIGFRHLQAIGKASADTPITIQVVEPNSDVHTRIADYLATLGNETARRARILSTMPDSAASCDIAIIATNSAARRAAYVAVVASHTPRVIVFEKVLFTKLGDLDAVGEDLTRRGIEAYVNCGRRTAPGYQALRTDLAGEVVDLDVGGAAWGLGSNAIHFLDLAEYLNRAPIVALDASELEPGSTPSKRDGYIEIFGTIEARLDNGAAVSIRCDKADRAFVTVELSAAGTKIAVDESAEEIRRPRFAPPEAFKMRHVSELTETYLDLLAGKQGGLTPYEDSARQHRFFLTALLGHFGLAPDADAICPVS